MAELHPDYWQWWILGVGLLVVETFFPGAFFLWMGISAVVAGLIVLAAPALNWEMQAFIFAVLSVVTAMMWRAHLRRNPTRSDQPNLNRRAMQYVGRVVTLREPIVNGIGKIRIDDSTWRVSGPDCAAGTVMEIVNANGAILTVRLKQ